jgi:DNA-binding transcriptional LysR family regulator
MDLDQLHTFLEIVRLKSFSKAAQTCFRTQPAVSAQVRQLEQELNAPLFDRLGTKIALTAAGKILAEYAEQILDLRRRAQIAINELERVPRGELVIAANEATCIHVLPRVFFEYKKLFPNVQILVDRAYGSRMIEAVLENQADFGIAQLPVKEKRLEVVRIHSDEVRAIVPAGHAFAAKPQILAGELSGHPLLLPKTGGTRARLTQWLESVEDEITISMELDSTEMIKRFVLAGLGVGFVAAAHCREEVSAGKLKSVALGPDAMERQIGLIYRKDKALSKAALGFIEAALSYAGHLGEPVRVPARGAGSAERGGQRSDRSGESMDRSGEKAGGKAGRA